MPKQIYKILGFHGGLNSDADPRDISDNQLAEATDVMVDKVGRITTLGSFATHDDVAANTATASQGRGLFQFSHDRRDAEISGTGIVDNVGGDDYLALVDGANSSVDIWGRDADAWGTSEFTLHADSSTGGASSPQPSIYAVDGALRVCDGNFANTSTPKWFGYIDRTYFPGQTEELALDGWYTEDQEIKAGNLGHCTHNSGASYPSHITPTITDGYISLSMIAELSDTGGMRGFKNYYYSLIYDGVQESKLLWMESATSQSDDVWQSSTKKYIIYVNAEEFTGTQNPGINKRCTGAKIYWKKVDSAYVAYDDAYLLLECDWIQGVKSPHADSYIAWADQGTTGVLKSGEIEFTDEPRFETYRTQTGFSEDVVSLAARYKTAVVVNRMTYIGNIFAKNKESTAAAVVMGDAMIKSPVNQFDSFPTDRILEVTIRDGDEIIHLAEFADRILQFKKKKLYIINVSQEIEFLEDELDNKGVNNPGSVAKTDMGIVWANKHGVFLYDGQKVTNLLERGGLKIISDSEWDSFLPADKDPMVGYIPNKRQVIVADAVDAGGDGSIFLFDFVTQSWIKGVAATITDAVKSNFVIDWDGELIYHDGSNAIQWNDAPASSSISIKTKDIDFGDPGVKKNIYKVYVSYKGDASAVTVSYQINGDTDAGSPFYRTTADGSSDGTNSDTTPLLNVATDDWVPGELKPVSSINNVYSFQLIFGGTAAADFEINDISIVYRKKGIR